MNSPKKRYNAGKSKGLDWIKSNLNHTGDDCLTWPFSFTRNGYGQMLYKGRMQRAHRVMCICAHGEPPPKHVAAHSCNNGHLGCVNPRHLAWKTLSENQFDRRHRGLTPRKLTHEQARKIRELKGLESTRDTAARYGIRESNVRLIQTGKTWRTCAQGADTR